MVEAQGGLAAELEVDSPPDTPQPSSRVCFLEQALGYDVDKRTIIDETIRRYPPDLLTKDSNLYVLIDFGETHLYKGGILAARTKNFLGYNTLDEFVLAVEAARKGVVVSFGQEDFNRFSAAVEQRNLWKVHEALYQDRLYKVHKYGNPPHRRN